MSPTLRLCSPPPTRFTVPLPKSKAETGAIKCAYPHCFFAVHHPNPCDDFCCMKCKCGFETSEIDKYIPDEEDMPHGGWCEKEPWVPPKAMSKAAFKPASKSPLLLSRRLSIFLRDLNTPDAVNFDSTMNCAIDSCC